MCTLLHGPSVCVFMYGQATESRWVVIVFVVVQYSTSSRTVATVVGQVQMVLVTIILYVPSTIFFRTL